MEDDSGGERQSRGKAGPPPLTKAQIERARLKKNEGWKDPSVLQRPSKYSTLTGQKTGPKWSFGKGADRFPSASANTSKELQRSKSSPAWSAQTSTTASVADFHEASLDFTSAEPSRVLTGPEASVEQPHGGFGDASDEDFNEDVPSSPSRHPRPPVTDRLKAPRLECGLDRLDEPEQRSAHPRAHSYDPIQTLGPGSSSTFMQSPNWSFGGGRSRTSDNKKKEHLAHIYQGASSGKKGKVSRASVTLMDLKDAIKPSHKPQAPLSRGFGSQARLQVKGGPMQLPADAPGPGRYELMQFGDVEPVWLKSHGQKSIWSNRTSGRADLRIRTGNPASLGPGGSCTDPASLGSKQASGPTPVFGHPLHDLSKPEYPGLEPTRYDLGSTLGRDRSPVYSLGSGKRSDLGPTPASPGPAQYTIKDSMGSALAISFGKSTRVHESDLVDPDEPPGPGAHTVREPKAPGLGLSKEERMRHTFGGGSFSGPGPGDCFKQLPSTLDLKCGRTMGPRLERSREESPGPCDTAGSDPFKTDIICHDAGPSWGELANRSSIRKPPWREVLQPPVFQLKSGEKLISAVAPLQFKPTGPKWSFMPRRDGKSRPPQGMCVKPGETEAFIVATSVG